MTQTHSKASVGNLIEKVSNQKPFSYLDKDNLSAIFGESKLIKFPIGSTLLKPDVISSRIYLVVQGAVRLLAKDDIKGEAFTLDKRGPGQLIGWAAILRAEPCEWVIASQDSLVLAIDSAVFLNCFRSNKDFNRFFGSLSSLHETYDVLRAARSFIPNPDEEWNNNLYEMSKLCVTTSLDSFENLQTLDFSARRWFISSNFSPNKRVGLEIDQFSKFIVNNSFNLPIRLVGLPSSIKSKSKQVSLGFSEIIEEAPAFSKADLVELGIVDTIPKDKENKFPIFKGSNPPDISVAVCEAIAKYFNVPFRREVIQKIADSHFRKGKNFSLPYIGGLLDVLGLDCKINTTNKDYISNIETPFVVQCHDDIHVIYHASQKKIKLLNPRHGNAEMSIESYVDSLSEGKQFKFLSIAKSSATPQQRFGFKWFYPLLDKYKKSLALVFVASLLAQLFGLAIPLIIQQIIDKVLSQGNLSSLNVLGSLMIVMALFQGILTALRTYIFVDTTDRIDLTLGSSVITRLLALPLRFFEKRPVGELSQRLGELNTIRSFLTGTALSAVLSIIFAFLYLVVMIVYSPLLTAVALSTIPVYIIMILIVAPIYKGLIRNKAVQQARTQSHLIEVLGGIQTVKAQHFERTARWKWQDRYSGFVNEGFKAVALGVTTGQIGSFLNTLSSLLVLWVGMWLVLKGELTLGMLIAFRIISGNVTSPLLQLSGLYQGYQGVQLSIERLSDIVDQNPEYSSDVDLNQISLPTVQGKIEFQDVCFRFAKTGPFQVQNVNLKIEPGSFVGIVGESGSGKSTLMKLLPRLYDPEKGRILIDDYDISKVNMSSLRTQIGIVPQESLLFEGSISENISLNDANATTESIIEAAKIACAHEFIMSLPQGYATQVAERGGNLSGGQRQRIAIARTVISNPNVLILDEATSALDYITEKKLCENLQLWASSKTVLFITHRLATIQKSDLILMMDKSFLIESGTHGELMSLGKHYYALYSQQSG